MQPLSETIKFDHVLKKGVFAFDNQIHEGEECNLFPLDCPQQCGISKMPREKVQKSSKNLVVTATLEWQ